MTLLKPLFKSMGWGTSTLPTSLTPRDDVVSSMNLPMSVLGAIALSGDYSATYEEIVKSQLWVRIAVNKLSYAIGRLPLKTYERGKDNDRERVSDSPLAQLLRRPNDSKDTGNATGFKARVAYDLHTYANAMIVKVQQGPDAVPDRLIPVSPRGWQIQGDEYVHRDTYGLETRIPSWRMIHIIEPGPAVDGFGVSRLEAARLTLAIEYAAQKLGVAAFRNGGRIPGFISFQGATKDTAMAFQEQFRTMYGGVDNAYKMPVVGGDVAFHELSQNMDDSAVVSHRQLTRVEVAALYDIPQPAIGILDEANFASIDALHLMFYQDTLGWPIKLIEDALMAQLVESVPAFENQYVEFDLNAVMRGSFESRVRAYATMITTGQKTPDEVRALENDPPMVDKQPEAGRLLFPMNLSGAVGAQLAEDVGQETP